MSEDIEFSEVTHGGLVDEPMSEAEREAEAMIEGVCPDCGEPNAADDQEGHACPGK